MFGSVNALHALSTTPILRVVNDLPVRDGADLLGVNVGTLMKWRASEGSATIHYARADRIAIRLGLPPFSDVGQRLVVFVARFPPAQLLVGFFPAQVVFVLETQKPHPFRWG
jgi:hypothetical protein